MCGDTYGLGVDPVSGKTYTAYPTGETAANHGNAIDPSYPGFDPLAGTPGHDYTGQLTYNGIDYGPAPNGGAGF
jgi:hypothetical protein